MELIQDSGDMIQETRRWVASRLTS